MSDNFKVNTLATLKDETSENGNMRTMIRVVSYEFDKGKTAPRLEKVVLFKNKRNEWYHGKRPGLDYDDMILIGQKWPEIKEVMKKI